MTDEPAVYVAPNDPNLAIKLCGKRVKFQNKKLELTNNAQVAELDKLLASGHPLSYKIQKLDIAEAERIAREHMAKRSPDAIKGSITTAQEELLKKHLEDEMAGKIDIDNPVAAQNYKEIIEGDPNVTETEKVDLQKTEAEQQAKIEAVQAEVGNEKPAEKQAFDFGNKS